MMNTGMEQIYVIDNIFQIHQDGNNCGLCNVLFYFLCFTDKKYIFWILVKSEVQVPNDCGTGIQLQAPIYAGNVIYPV